MNNLAIISEFNPFHNGHKYLLDKAKEELNADLSISLMSGDFVQRGDASILGKYKRAYCAVKLGFDLVIEMPNFISLQAAEFFARKSIEILDKIKVDYLVFGIEKIDPKEFLSNCDIILSNKENILALQKSYMKQGLSFTRSKNMAISKFIDQDFLTSNNILALEYISSIREISSNITPYPIKRMKSLNQDKDFLDERFASSTAIRNNINKNIVNFMPEISFNILDKYRDLFTVKDDKYLYNILKYKLFIEKKPMDQILSFEDGMDNYFRKIIKDNSSFEDFLNQATSQRYTKSRIRRLTLNYILANEEYFNNLDIDFIKILAYNKKSTNYFSDISKNMQIVINKSDSCKLKSNSLLIYKNMIDASNLYSLLTNTKINYDYLHNNRPIN